MAALAGVSRATAGRVLSGSPRVSPAAKQAVLDAAAELSYVTNRAARSLVTRRSDSIAFVVSESEERLFQDPFFPAVLRGAHRAVSDQSIQLVFVVLATPAEHEQFFRFAAGGHVDGAMFISLHGDDPLPNRLREVGIPVVLSGRPFRPDDDIPNVDADNVAGARLATRALLDVGCTRLATITGPLDMPAAQDRLSRLRAGARGVRPQARRRPGRWSPTSPRDGGFDAMNRLLRQRFAPDGVFAANDQMAVGAMRAIREAGPDRAGRRPGRRVRRQPARHRRAPAADVRAPAHGAARPRDGPAADGPGQRRGHATTSVMLPTELVVRETT